MVRCNYQEYLLYANSLNVKSLKMCGVGNIAINEW